MNFEALATRSRQNGSIEQTLRQQLLWMLLLRIVLYTILMGLIDLFQNTRFEIITPPRNLLILFLLLVYLTTIISAILLLLLPTQLRIFGFLQNLLDTFFASLLVYYTGSSQSIFTSVYFFPIIAGGLILPRKGGLVAAAAASLQYAAILFFELLGVVPEYLADYGFRAATNPLVSINHFGVLGLVFFLAAMLSAIFGLRLQTTEDALSDSLRNFDRLATLYKQIFDNISTGILTIDGAQVITSANPATAAITGYPPEHLIGRRLSESIPKMTLTGTDLRLAADFTRPDGTTIKLGYSYVPILPPDETAPAATDIHKIITLRDISEIERMEQQMRQSEKLAAIGMMSAGIAHDFRNPLTAISGSAQILAQELSSADPSSRMNLELAEIIVRESNRMIHTIGDFLKFSRPETVNSEWFSLHSCLAEVIQVCRADPQWPATCSLHLNFDRHFDLWADQKQMFTVFSHLIHNAILFCPPGHELIEIDAEIPTGQDDQEMVVISVLDNGPGVPEDTREKIFEPFFTTRADGTGLGLAIARQTIKEHRGTISVSTGRLGGARFSIQLPLPS
ncbi:MAG: two-component system sensor histidine kinase NtrB [Desulfoprunum sp.]|jgi:two-component system sensor histidine kinase PilS (NtrC family)